MPPRIFFPPPHKSETTHKEITGFQFGRMSKNTAQMRGPFFMRGRQLTRRHSGNGIQYATNVPIRFETLIYLQKLKRQSMDDSLRKRLIVFN